jgi:RecB family exonuclease
MPLAVSQEIHTTELGEPCQRKIQLRLLGRSTGQMTEALALGSLWHETAPRLHREEGVKFATSKAFEAVVATMHTEGRRMSAAVEQKVPDIIAQVEAWAIEYVERIVKGLTASWKIIGFEVPVRMAFDVDGEPADFASHIDMLARMPDGRLVFMDWKTGQDTPTVPYLARNPQLAAYCLAVARGSVMLDDEWVDMAEWPEALWCHVRGLEPYKRKTTTLDEHGNELVYGAGEPRPIDRIIFPAIIGPEAEPHILNELAINVRMRRAGLFPARPDPIGCMACECREYCPVWNEEPHRANV